MTTPPVGFIGLGNMGGRMTRCLVAAGLQVVGFDVRTENIDASGAEAAADVREVFRRCDVVLLSLPDSTVVEALMLGADGAIDHVRDGQLVVDLSTASPDSTRRIHAALARKGGGYLDAGISGGAAAADKGTLTLMVGGSADALDAVRSVLELFSSKIFYCGETGAGHVTKLLNNFLNAVSLAATAEVMVAGKRAGLDLAVLLDVLNAGSGVNFATLNRFPKIIEGDYLKGGLSNSLMLKDVLLYAELAGKLGVASMNSAGPLASFGAARALGYADDISNTVVDAIGDLSGGVRLFEPIGEDT